MTPDSGPGIPGWFVALIILGVMISIGTFVWRISAARKMASDAGLDPDKATTAALLGRDGLDATYIASTLARRPQAQTPPAAQTPKTTEQRLQELQALKDKGLVTDDEYTTQRAQILGSI